MAVQPFIQAPFALEVEDQGTTRTISLAEEVDIAAAPALKAAIQTALSDSGCETLVIDLSAVTFIETTGITALYKAYRQSEQDGVRLVLIPAGPEVQRAFALCGGSEPLPFAMRATGKLMGDASV
jgi:anti-sigma B factor antagonist